MRVCGGYILIKIKWFQSTKSMEIKGTLPILVPHQGFLLDPSGVSNPPSNSLLKSVSLKNLWIRHWNGYTIQQTTKISKIIKNSSMTDNSARYIFCHIWDLLHKKNHSLLLNFNPVILNLVKLRLFYRGSSLQNTIKMPRKSVQKVTQNKSKKHVFNILVLFLLFSKILHPFWYLHP